MLPRTLALLLLSLILPIACDRPGDDATVSSEPPQQSLRIVSLSPAISRTLVDFDLGERVIGRTQWCSSLDESVPIAGDLLHVDYERLVRLHPTHILIQPRVTGPDDRLLELARQNGWAIGQWTLNDRDDIEILLRDLPAVLYGENDPARPAAVDRANQLIAKIDDALQPAESTTWRGRVLLIDSIDPVVVFGRETYLHDILTALGGENASNVAGWKELSLEDITRLDPEAIIVVAPGADARQGEEEAVEALRRLDVEAVRVDRIGVLTDPDALLPSSAIIEVARELREILRSFE
jgi:ABC-type hemin transport system substrate-binding protein